MTITVQDAFETFILAKQSENVVPATINLYEWTIGLWQKRWPGVCLNEIGPDHVRRFVLWLQGHDDQPAPTVMSSSTVHINFRNVRAFLRWCESEGMLDASASPLKNVRAPKVEETIPDVLTEWEAADLLRRVKNNGDRHAYRDYVIHLFFLCTGARLSELAGLNMADVDLKQGYAKLNGKMRRQRIVPLFGILPLEIKRYTLKHRHPVNGEPALFVNDQGGRLQSAGVQKVVIRDLTAYVKRELNRVGPHTERHTACTFLLRRLKEIKSVSIIMGHTNVETTERYTHLAFDDLKGVVRPTLEDLLKGRGKRALPA